MRADANAQIMTGLAKDLLAPPVLPLRRIYNSFDPQAETAMESRLDQAWMDLRAAARPLPLVSVIMPTRDRANVLPTAVTSVLSQDYPNLELLVIDDASCDETATLPILTDARVRLLKPHGTGVAAARNAGLDAANGEIISFLDSDNVWQKRHLRDLVTSLEITGADCCYSVLRLDGENGTHRFRGEPFHWEECLRGNYVDMNVFAYRAGRRPDMEVRFDPLLRRGVDWDFILRLTRGASVAFVPVQGCSYSDVRGAPDRITISEPRIFLTLVREKNQDRRPLSEIIARRSFQFRIWPGMGADRLSSALRSLGHRVELGNGKQAPTACEVAIVHSLEDGLSLRPDVLKVLFWRGKLHKPNYAVLDRFDVVLCDDASAAAHLTAVLRRPILQVSEDALDAAQRTVAAVRNSLGQPRRMRSAFPMPCLINRAPVRVGLIAQRGRNWPNASAYLRVISPLTTSRSMKRLELTELSGPEDPRLKECQIVLLQRFALPTVEAADQLADRLALQGSRLVVDSDDHSDAIGASSARSMALLRAMSLADRVYVASRALQRLHGDHRAQFVPNRLDPRIWRSGLEPAPPPKKGKAIRIVYIGTPTHDADFLPVRLALDRLWEERPEAFQVTILGALRTLPQSPWVDPRSQFTRQTAYPDFCQRAMGFGPFHLGLAPLGSSVINSAKSDLRCLDNAALGAVTLASDCPAYAEAITTGRALGVAHTEAAWLATLRVAIDAPDWINQRAKDITTWLWQERSVLCADGLDVHLSALLDGGPPT